MKVGDIFSSYKEFNVELSKYKKLVQNEYWIRDARTIANQHKRHPDTVKNANEILKYYYLVLTCIRGGRKFESKHGTSTRNCSTSKQDCPAAIHLHMSKCKQHLTVTKLNECHNHKQSAAYFNSLSQQRLKLPVEVRKDICELLETGANKKLVLEKVKIQTGCNITLKDLTNINRRKEKKNFEECISMLKNVYSCDVKLLISGDGTFNGLYFQDKRMKQYFEAFPEVLFIDGTYCLVDIRTAVYIIMIEDSNGRSEIVAVCLLCQENEESIEFFISTFKELNTSWEKVKVIMSDKDKTERNIFKKHFPEAKLMICLFHVFQIFNREVSNRKMGITSEEAKISKEYLQKLTYSSSESEYKEIYEQMKENVPILVQTYFQNNWANITDQWVKYLTFKNLCLSNSTNNRLECMNGKLKTVINRYSPLEDFIKHLFAVINSHRIGNDTRNLQLLHKRPVKLPSEDSAEYLFANQLTTFAYEKVKQQLEFSSSCKEFIAMGDKTYIATTSEGLLKVTANSCECTFRTSNMLPCRHIFKCRKLLSLPLFDINLSLQRWTKVYYEAIVNKEEFNEKKEAEEEEMNLAKVKILQQDDRNCKRLSNHQKFKIMDEQCKIMSQMCSEVSTPIFYQRLNLIKSIINKWAKGDFKLRSISQSPNHDLTEENIECLPSTSTSNTGNQDNKCLPITATCNTGCFISDCIDIPVPHKISLKDIKMPPRILKRGRPKGLGNTVIGLKRGKRYSNTTKSLITFKQDHQDDNIESFIEEEYLENIEERCIKNNLDLAEPLYEHQEKNLNQYLNEDDLNLMEEEYLDEEFLE